MSNVSRRDLVFVRIRCCAAVRGSTSDLPLQATRWWHSLGFRRRSQPPALFSRSRPALRPSPSPRAPQVSAALLSSLLLLCPPIPRASASLSRFVCRQLPLPLSL